MTIKVLQLPSVRHQFIEQALNAEGVAWRDALHITTTPSLKTAIANAQGEDTAVSVLISEFIDMIVMPGMPGDSRVQLPQITYTNVRDLYPTLSQWDSLVKGKRLNLNLRFNNSLRGLLRDNNRTEIALSVYDTRRSFYKTITNLIANGIYPDDVQTDDPVADWAKNAWRKLEHDLPDICQIRQDMWIDPNDFRENYTSHAQSLRQRIINALELFFGTKTKKVLVYHGFFNYFATQWALVKLLNFIPNVEQIFITHDDGINPAFETWRKYYDERWRLAKPKKVYNNTTPTNHASILLSSFKGEKIVATNTSSSLQLLECSSPAEFVNFVSRDYFSTKNNTSPKIYAADKPTINRYIERLGSFTQSRQVDLAKLPVGTFLVRLHEFLPTAYQKEIVLNADGLGDIIATGFLKTKTQNITNLLQTWRKVTPFFDGCDASSTWISRAKLLQNTIRQMNDLTEYQSHLEDIKRINTLASNMYKLVPWADISTDEADAIHGVINETVRLVESIATKEQIKLEHHFTFIKRELERGMRDLPPQERKHIEEKLTGFGIYLDEEIYVDELVSVVDMILGRTIPVDVFGQDEENQYDIVLSLRSLDALGFNRTTHPIHLANIADGVFPTTASVSLWPFKLDELQQLGEPISIQILETRSKYSHLEDLYLLWLALDGVEDAPITISWIANIAGETYNRSAVLDLLALPNHRVGQHVIEMIGGIPVTKSDLSSDSRALVTTPPPLSRAISYTDEHTIWSGIDKHARAAHILCHRRFAMQWGVGPTIAFQSSHHQEMLYGNMHGAGQMRVNNITPALVEALWPHLTPGEKSSRINAGRVKRGGARPSWMYTLGGSQDGNDYHSRAYQVAFGKNTQAMQQLESGNFLPKGHTDINKGHICANCAVRIRCAYAIDGNRDD